MVVIFIIFLTYNYITHIIFTWIIILIVIEWLWHKLTTFVRFALLVIRKPPWRWLRIPAETCRWEHCEKKYIINTEVHLLVIYISWITKNVNKQAVPGTHQVWSGDSLMSGLQGHWNWISVVRVHLVVCAVLLRNGLHSLRFTVEPNTVWAVLPIVVVTERYSRSLVVWHRVPVTSWKITAHSVAFCLDKFSGQHETAGLLLAFICCCRRTNCIRLLELHVCRMWHYHGANVKIMLHKSHIFLHSAPSLKFKFICFSYIRESSIPFLPFHYLFSAFRLKNLLIFVLI